MAKLPGLGAAGRVNLRDAGKKAVLLTLFGFNLE